MRHVQIGDHLFTVHTDVPFRSRNELVEAYWFFHPRFRFLKTVPSQCRLLDLGAGPGGLQFWRGWGYLNRIDVAMFAVDLEAGQFFDHYVDYQVCNLETDTLKFGDQFFNAVLMSHVMEHIRNKDFVMSEIDRVLRPGGYVYLEVPTPESESFPSRTMFEEAGISVSTVNFRDDNTHIATLSLSELAELGRHRGFRVLEEGLIRNPMLDDYLFSSGLSLQDPELVTYGVWGKLGFAHYVMFQKPLG